MGSSLRSYPTVTAECDKKPKSARSHFAEAVVDGLLAYLKSAVLQPEYTFGKARECYEVSNSLRENSGAFRRIVREIVTGSDLRDRGISLASKIVVVFSNMIDIELIRPGPTPAERDCATMVVEAAQMRGRLIQLVSDVIKVDDDERKITPDHSPERELLTGHAEALAEIETLTALLREAREHVWANSIFLANVEAQDLLGRIDKELPDG